MRILAYSDWHNLHDMIDRASLPGDALILHAGDAMVSGKHPKELLNFALWWNAIENTKYIVPGNHDGHFYPGNSEYTELYRRLVDGLKIDEEVVIGNAKIWFSPWSRKYRGDTWAANEHKLVDIYENIPKDTNILVSHGPPFGILDTNMQGVRCGSEALMLAINNLPELKLVIFGHIHESRGIIIRDGIHYVNAANCGIPYSNFNPEPIDIIYDEINNKVVSIK